MPHAVILELDDAGGAAIDEIAAGTDVAGEFTTPRQLGWGHHLTLAVYSAGRDLPGIEERLQEFATATPALPISFSGAGYFPGEHNVLYLAPVASAELLALHQLYHAVTTAFGSGAEHYHPGKWVPHVTLAIGVPTSKLGAIVERVALQWQPVNCLVDRIRLVEFHPARTKWSAQLDGAVPA